MEYCASLSWLQRHASAVVATALWRSELSLFAHRRCLFGRPARAKVSDPSASCPVSTRSDYQDYRRFGGNPSNCDAARLEASGVVLAVGAGAEGPAGAVHPGDAGHCVPGPQGRTRPSW